MVKDSYSNKIWINSSFIRCAAKARKVTMAEVIKEEYNTGVN